MPQPAEALTTTDELRPESGADLRGDDAASPDDDQARGLTQTRQGGGAEHADAELADEGELATGPADAGFPAPAEAQTGGGDVVPDDRVASRATTARRVGDLALPECTGDAEADTIGSEQVKAEIARSDTLIADVAAREADRLERMLDDPDLTDLETRQSLLTAVSRLRATDNLHTAHVPVQPEDAHPAGMLHKSFGAEDRGSLGDTAGAQPFVSAVEHERRTPDTALERAAEFKHGLVVEANRAGDPIRRAAMDKAPDAIGRRPKLVSWTTRDPEVPGYEYKFDATFNPEGGRPSLANVTCAFSPITTRRNPMVDGLNATHALYTPLTVSAHFDGPNMTGLDLVWRHPSIDKSGGKRFGPTGEALAGEGRGQLLAGLVRRVDAETIFATQGVIELSVGDSPQVQIMPRGSAFDSARGFDRTFARAHIRSLGQHKPTTFTYNAAQHAFLAPGAGGRTQIIDAEGVAGLMHDIARFFPVMRG